MTRLLVSVRDLAEARAAAAAGADFIDLKDPAAGALGGLPPAHIAALVKALRAEHPRLPISATIGDHAAHDVAAIVQRVAAVAACGVDYVKVGVQPGRDAPALLRALAICDAPVVPVLLADDGVDGSAVAVALGLRAFPAVMLDTQHKHAGSLLARVVPGALAAFIAEARRQHCLSGLAGALRADDVPGLRALAPDFAGFRSAVCSGERSGTLEPGRVRALQAALASEPAPRVEAAA